MRPRGGLPESPGSELELSGKLLADGFRAAFSGLGFKLDDEPSVASGHLRELVQQHGFAHSPQPRQENAPVTGSVGLGPGHEKVEGINFGLPADKGGRLDAGPGREWVQGWFHGSIVAKELRSISKFEIILNYLAF
jgi:hypothetical protein